MLAMASYHQRREKGAFSPHWDLCLTSLCTVMVSTLAAKGKLDTGYVAPVLIVLRIQGSSLS
jgi:hypothetical protein